MEDEEARKCKRTLDLVSGQLVDLLSVRITITTRLNMSYLVLRHAFRFFERDRKNTAATAREPLVRVIVEVGHLRQHRLDRFRRSFDGNECAVVR